MPIYDRPYEVRRPANCPLTGAHRKNAPPWWGQSHYRGKRSAQAPAHHIKQITTEGTESPNKRSIPVRRLVFVDVTTTSIHRGDNHQTSYSAQISPRISQT